MNGKTLRRGDSFRAKGGPYFRSSSGSRTKMAERGPFKFLAYCEQGEQRWLEAVSSGGGFTILSLTERENAMMPEGYVARPYRITAGGRRGAPVAAVDDADIEPGRRRGRPDKADRKAAREAARSRRERGGLRGAIGRALTGGGGGAGPEAAGAGGVAFA